MGDTFLKRLFINTLGVLKVEPRGGKSKRGTLMKSIDTINAQMGRDKVRLAVQGFDRRWRLRQERLSPCYTTRFADILTVSV